MRLVGKHKLDEFGRHHADVRPPLNAWIDEVEEEEWRRAG